MTAPLRSFPRPPGVVSTIRGRWQGPALLWTTRSLFVLAITGGLAPGAAGRSLAVAAAAVVAAVPLLRVVWLVVRWAQESDRRFVAVGAGLLAVVAAGATLAALGVGR